MAESAYIAPSADVAADAVIGSRTRIWHLAQIREGAHIGDDCTIGRGAYVGTGVSVGDACKVQNHALIYEPALLGDGVFIGPAVVLTNDAFPRAINPDGSPKTADDWVAVGVTVGRGASIGARAVCIAPVNVGEWSLVAAGAVVTKDVAPYALVAGVPARRIGWVGRAGQPLQPADSEWVCPATGERYRQDGERLTPVAETDVSARAPEASRGSAGGN